VGLMDRPVWWDEKTVAAAAVVRTECTLAVRSC
jgi:hypothetical protein